VNRYFSLVFGNSVESTSYWNKVLKFALQNKFELILSEKESKLEDFKTIVTSYEVTNTPESKTDGRSLLFKRTCELTALRFSGNAPKVQI
jgi:hypothetical protein